jgi:hypothetical protein
MGPTNISPKVEAEVEAAASQLPPRYRMQMHTLLKDAEKKDPGYWHYWVRKSPQNEQMKRWAGLEPVEDKARLERMGLGGLIAAGTGRATWLTSELWAMPTKQHEAIVAHRNTELDARFRTIREEVEGQFAEITGQSKGRVRPFIKTDKREVVNAA